MSEAWTLNRGGRSVDTGGARIRCDADRPGEVPKLMERIARLPEMEAELERLRAVISSFDHDTARIVVEGCARAHRERDDALAVVAQVEPELERLRRLEAATLAMCELRGMPVSEYPGDPIEALIAAIAETQAAALAKVADRG